MLDAEVGRGPGDASAPMPTGPAACFRAPRGRGAPGLAPQPGRSARDGDRCRRSSGSTPCGPATWTIRGSHLRHASEPEPPVEAASAAAWPRRGPLSSVGLLVGLPRDHRLVPSDAAGPRDRRAVRLVPRGSRRSSARDVRTLVLRFLDGTRDRSPFRYPRWSTFLRELLLVGTVRPRAPAHRRQPGGRLRRRLRSPSRMSLRGHPRMCCNGGPRRRPHAGRHVSERARIRPSRVRPEVTHGTAPPRPMTSAEIVALRRSTRSSRGPSRAPSTRSRSTTPRASTCTRPRASGSSTSTAS